MPRPGDVGATNRREHHAMALAKRNRLDSLMMWRAIYMPYNHVKPAPRWHDINSEPLRYRAMSHAESSSAITSTLLHVDVALSGKRYHDTIIAREQDARHASSPVCRGAYIAHAFSNARSLWSSPAGIRRARARLMPASSIFINRFTAAPRIGGLVRVTSPTSSHRSQA